MKEQKYFPGQRWLSKMEQELGLGIIFNVTDDQLDLFFPAAKCQRKYNISSAPLKRVVFKEGDFIKNHLGKEYLVTELSEEQGLITYICDSHLIPESELYDSLVSSEPFERLNYGLVDDTIQFTMRLETLRMRTEILKSPYFGFAGGKIDLLPHQLYAAKKVTDLPLPRVLLSDETGLGKTIEACLIMHRLLLTNRISRVLILLPEPLIFQWFAEILRKFNLKFTIFNKEYYESVKDLTVEEGEANPFLHSQLFLADVKYLANNEELNLAVNSSDWDLVIVDEAHHLDIETKEYSFVHELSKRAKGLLLLTATPEQLGHENHFNRLKLLDSDRFFNYENFLKEEKNYSKVSKLVSKLLDFDGETIKTTKIEDKIIKEIKSDFKSDDLELLLGNDLKKSKLIESIVDRYGAGRAVIRNTRENISGFSKRKVSIINLEASSKELEQAEKEFSEKVDCKIGGDYNFVGNAKIEWLGKILKKNKNEKFVLICNSAIKAKAIEEALKEQINTKISMFHEKLTLLQRDKNASWFASSDGAQILISSEIGSEGRNFQFAHNLILFDLPLNPEMLEQRIGRLDRIGQKEIINIFVPVFKGSKQELFAAWYNKGLNAFVKNIPGVYLIYQQIKDELIELIQNGDEIKFEDFIKSTAKLTKDTVKKVKKGRDALLELNSFSKEAAEDLRDKIANEDTLKKFETYVLKLFNYFNLISEEEEEYTHKINLDFVPSADFPLPLIRYDELIITFKREQACKHETMEFLTPEHPMVFNTMELLLGSENGNSIYATWEDTGKTEIIMETVFVAECTAPQNLNINRFFPPQPIRKVVNHDLMDLSKIYSEQFLTTHSTSNSDVTLFDNKTLKHKVLPEMLKTAEDLAKADLEILVQLANEQIQESISYEINRLKELKKSNKFIQDKDIELLELQIEDLCATTKFARVRLDCIRLVKRS